MDIRFHKLTDYNLSDFEKVIEWDSDPDIKPFLLPNKNEEEKKLDIKEYIDKEKRNKNKTIYWIKDNEKLIGYVSIIKNFEFLTKKDSKTSWIGICIGNKSYWGLGVGTKAMKFLEEESRRLGYERIELGVFEMNTKARRLYKKLGYQEIARNPKFTYYNGKWYDDIRMEKYLK